jgi:hypothetical protein
MTNQTQGQMDGSAESMAIIRVEENAYSMPVAVMERYRITPERRSPIEAALRDRATAGEVPAEAPLYEVPEETLQAYRLSDEERAALEAQQTERGGDVRGFGHMGGERNPWPIDGYTGFHRNESLGGLERGPNGRMVYIGVFPMYRAPSSSGPYPGLR